MRTAPSAVAPLVIRLQTGARLSVSSNATNGWRVVLLSDGRLGYIDESTIRLK